jgi:hypothetical protein
VGDPDDGQGPTQDLELEMKRAARRRGLALGSVPLLVAGLGALSCDGTPEEVDSRTPAPAERAISRQIEDDSAASEGTRRMAARLRDLADRAAITSNPYLNDRRVELLLAATPPTDPARRLSFDLAVAQEHLKAGLTKEAVRRFEEVCARLDEAPEWRDTAAALEARSWLAVAYLRLGEQRNCVEHHGSESCILPIRGDGVHRDTEGSRAAVRELSALLARNPDDLRSRWLLNVASMTLGEYPDGVPAAHRIPPSAFASEADVGRFRDVAARVGLDALGLAGGAILEDFDGDRHLDVLLTSWGMRDPIRYFRNDRNGAFSDRTEAAGLAGIVSGLNAVHADFDNDGDVDVYVMRGAWQNDQSPAIPSLLRNRGDGRFDDVTEEAGLLVSRPSQAAAWGDFDNDGWLDLYVAGETLDRGAKHPNGLYRNNRDGTFTDVAEAAGVAAVGFFKGAAWGDYDNDGRLDLYVTAHHTRPANRLFHNDGPDAAGVWRFTEVADRAGVRGPPLSFPTWFFDYDNDGWLDLFVGGFGGTEAGVAADYLGIGTRTAAETPHLYRNQRDGTFHDVTREVRLDRVVPAMGSNFGDLDNDGWLDIYLGTGRPDFRTLVPNRMFRNSGGRVFQDVTTSGGFGHLQKGHGVAFGDLDNDGDQDVLLKVGGAYTGDVFQTALFENPGHGNHWIALTLVGVESNRAALGARIAVTVDEGGARRTIHATVGGGSSFGGSPLRREIGLGAATRIRRIEIVWPASGRRQRVEDLAVDQFLEIREDGAAPRPVHVDRLELGSSGPPPSPDREAAHAGHHR